MIKAINKRIRNKKGFTLVELIVVIAVLGIISAIAVPRFVGIQEEAKKKADVATARSLAKATELAIAKGDIEIPDNNDNTVNIQSDLVGKNYLDSKPVPQSVNNKEFVIIVNESGKIRVGIGTINNGSGTIDTELYPDTDSNYSN
ncbi:type II secretion system protein [Caloranaerobacter sp. TR13]|uniref:type II secretion system protein n=1 Tax=Caloranaerobacter sp. TR13 TaxID=1302151 RepID=UPI0006D46664|nr:type II secretion system protein [Caloranaerobacter sp. TR13]